MDARKVFEGGFGKSNVIEVNGDHGVAAQDEAVGRGADKLKPRRLDWLWHGWILRGGLTFIIGDPDAGKSTLLANLIASHSRGSKWPDGTKAARGVALYYTVEENVQGAFIPRLIAAGADRRRVKVVAAVPSADGNGSGGLRVLPEGIADMRRATFHHRATMIVLDPISDYFQANTDTNSEVAVRSALKPLARLAEDLNIAIICIRHLNKKSGDQALYRMLGSSAFIQMPRAILKVEHDPEIEHGRVLSCIKGNYVIKPLARRFKLTSGRNGIVRIEWGAVLDRATEESIAEGGGTSPKKLEDACDQLKELLAGGAAESRSVEAAMRSVGVSDRTRYRAYDKLGVEREAVRDDQSGRIVKWHLSLPKAPR